MLNVIILNYNGWADTEACLASLAKQTYQDVHVVVADNGSTEVQDANLQLWQNYGFAKGNNLAIQTILPTLKPTDYILCLNNDTELEPTCLEVMVHYMDAHPDVVAVTPSIYLWNDRERLWNAGGKLVFGGRRYYGAGEKKQFPDHRITFITGCALMVRPSVLMEDGKLFTERFFFGEEDYDFSMRMKKQGKKMMCLQDAVIYHKVSASTQDMSNLGKLFIYVLNRMIDLRIHYPHWKYALWKSLYIPYVRRRFLKNETEGRQEQFIASLLKESQKDYVDKETYEFYAS